jgi:hypothetical protein
MLEITMPAPQLAAWKKIEIQLDGQALARSRSRREALPALA